MKGDIESNLKHVFALLKEAKFIEAMELYLHDDVILREGNGDPKKGKAFNVKFEQDFIDNQLAEFVRYEVGNYAVNGNYSYYDAIMELKLKRNWGGAMILNQKIIIKLFTYLLSILLKNFLS